MAGLNRQDYIARTPQKSELVVHLHDYFKNRGIGFIVFHLKTSQKLDKPIESTTDMFRFKPIQNVVQYLEGIINLKPISATYFHPTKGLSKTYVSTIFEGGNTG